MTPYGNLVGAQPLSDDQIRAMGMEDILVKRDAVILRCVQSLPFVGLSLFFSASPCMWFIAAFRPSF